MEIFGFVVKVFFIGLTIYQVLQMQILWVVFQWTIKNVKQDCMLLILIDMRLGFFLFSNETSQCSGSCNNINYPYAKICVPDVVKNLNVKVFNLMWRTNETRFIKLHETSKCECKFGENVCNNKQRWNKDKCRYEC